MMGFGKVLVLAAGLAVSGVGLAAAAELEPIDITMIIYTAQGTPFFDPVIKGAEEAAQMMNVNLDIQYADNDTGTQNNITQTAIANGVDGIATIIWDDSAFDEQICAAMDAGIPVIAYNIDDSQGADGNCRMAFIGQDFVDTGYLIGKRMIQEHGIKQGDVVFTPVEFPEAVYAVLRHQGVEKALQEVGATSEMVGVGVDLPSVLATMVQYLLGHPDTAAIIGLGQQPMMVAEQAMAESGVTVPVGGFDVSPEILDGIKTGAITATVDQQPYTQGFYAIAQLAQNIRYGLYPSDMKTGGRGLIDKSNYESAVQWAGQYR